MNPFDFVPLCSHVCARPRAPAFDANAISFARKALYNFAELLFQFLYVVCFVSCFCCLSYTIDSATLSTRGLAH